MSIAIAIQFAALLAIVVIGVSVLYVIFEMREVYAEQRTQFIRAVAAVAELQALQPKLLSIVEHARSDGEALQSIALQIETAVGALQNSVGAASKAQTERQTAVIEDLKTYLDFQEQQLAKALDAIAESLNSQSRIAAGSEQSLRSEDVNTKGNGNGNGHGSYVRLRRDVITQDPQVRFSALKDWVATNSLSILRRASRGAGSPADMIASIPTYLQPTAELSHDHTLLIGTRGYTEKVPLQLTDVDVTGV